MAITLNTKTYNFAGHQAPIGQSVYMERSAGIPQGFSPLSVKVEEPNAKGQSKVRWKLKLPVLVTETTACACEGDVASEDFVDLIVTFGKGNTTARRTDVLDRLQDLVLTTEFTSSVTSLLQPSA